MLTGPYEAMAEAVGPHSKQVSQAIGCSQNLVGKWQRPHDDPLYDTGARSDLERLADTIQICLNLGRKEKAYAPIRWLNVRFGFFPPIRVPEFNADIPDVLKGLSGSIREFGEFLATTQEKTSDGDVSRSDAKEIWAEGLDVVEKIVGVMMLAKTLSESERSAGRGGKR